MGKSVKSLILCFDSIDGPTLDWDWQLVDGVWASIEAELRSQV